MAVFLRHLAKQGTLTASVRIIGKTSEGRDTVRQDGAYSGEAPVTFTSLQLTDDITRINELP